MGDPLRDLVSGAIILGNLVVGLFFLRFWKETTDRLFLIFGFAFWLLAVQRISLVLFAGSADAEVYLYLIRLAAFVMIIIAILDKNRIVQQPR
jgi:hypothetical protein